MSARQVAHSVPEPFRSEWQNAIERGYAMSPRTVCELFKVSRGAVHNALTIGDLPGFRLGKEWRIRPENIPEPLIEYWLVVKRNPYVPPPPEPVDLPTGELVYFITGAPGFVKIGYTTDLTKRIRALQIGCPLVIELLAYVRGSRRAESDYHYQFRAWRQAGEWFKLSDPIKAEIARLSEEGASNG